MKFLILVLILLKSILLFPTETDLTIFQFFHDIETVPTEQELAYINIDRNMWDSSNWELYIKIEDENGSSVPLIFDREKEQKERFTVDTRYLKITSLTEKPDNSIEMILDIGKVSGEISKIEFVTSLKDFEKKVSIHGIETEGLRTLLVENTLIYDYSKFADVRHVSIDLPKNNFRSFVVNIYDISEEIISSQTQITESVKNNNENSSSKKYTVKDRILRIDAVKAYLNVSSYMYDKIEMKELKVKNVAIKEDEENSSTIIDIETFFEPLNKITLKTSQKNFVRDVSVQIHDTATKDNAWRTVSRSTISKISFRDVHKENLNIDFSRIRSRNIRVIVHNKNNSSIQIDSIGLKGPISRALFIAEPGKKLKLFYGGNFLQCVGQGSEPVRQIIKEGFKPILFKIGEQQKNPVYKEMEIPVKGFIGSRLFFILAIGLMVIALSTVLYKIAKGV